jgi:cytochrome b561
VAPPAAAAAARPAHFAASARLLHWAMALLLVSMVFVGATMVDALAVWQPALVRAHQATGVLALALVLLRLANRLRLRGRTPALPDDLPRVQRLAARATQVALYALMLAIPLVGWAMQGAAGLPVVLPGGVVLPALLGPDLATYGLLREAHAWLAYGLFALVLVHAGAALQHGLVRRDGVLRSMLRGR